MWLQGRTDGTMSDKSDLKAELERKKQRLAQIREEKKRKEEERKKKEVRKKVSSHVHTRSHKHARSHEKSDFYFTVVCVCIRWRASRSGT